MPSADVSTIAGRIADIRSSIARACERAGREAAEVTLIGVTKTFTVDDVDEAIAAGLEDFGENRAQELLPKVEEASRRGLHARWHFIGHLQRNKVRDVLPHIVALHSLDSLRLAATIESEAERTGLERLRCYIEVNVAEEASKEGVPPAELPGLLSSLAVLPHLEVAGLMTVAPQVPDAEQVRPVFRALRELASANGLRGLSMGMSEDYAVAIEEGATVVRVGRALFGPRV
ncbi:MAG TPA: YggS family pyridoxal phosphate-dependent enzyme [Dehalococcoidia bacterium]|nr:YggS family pyridoxal phosphate-dependent enzyme [Dehalococcoidia bacterium]